jgi:hypothetical protein
LKDKSLFIEAAYINGKWDKKAKTFDVSGKTTDERISFV